MKPPQDLDVIVNIEFGELSNPRCIFGHMHQMVWMQGDIMFVKWQCRVRFKPHLLQKKIHNCTLIYTKHQPSCRCVVLSSSIHFDNMLSSEKLDNNHQSSCLQNIIKKMVDLHYKLHLFTIIFRHKINIKTATEFLSVSSLRKVYL